MLLFDRINECIKESRKKNDPAYIDKANNLIVLCQGKNDKEINFVFDSIPFTFDKEIKYRILKFGLILINRVGAKHPSDLITAYIVGSIAGGYCKNRKQRRKLFKYIHTPNHRLAGIEINLTDMVLPDLDLEIIVSNNSLVIKETIINVYQEIISDYSEFSNIPIDIRIITQEDAEYYLQIKDRPSYLIFRLLFGSPLPLYNQSNFDFLLERAFHLITDNYNEINAIPEWRMWKAYMDEVNIIKMQVRQKKRYISKNELKTLGDLYWFYSLRVDNPKYKNISNFPSHTSSKSFKIKLGYTNKVTL